MKRVESMRLTPKNMSRKKVESVDLDLDLGATVVDVEEVLKSSTPRKKKGLASLK